MSSFRSATSFGRTGLLPWLAAFLPGVAMLVMMWPLRVSVPYLDGWAFVQQYQRWIEGTVSAQIFFQPHYVHPSAVGKVIYFAVLHWLGGDVGLLPLLMWIIAAGVTACLCRLSRFIWIGHVWWGVALMFLVGLTTFSAAQGEVWIWGFLFQNSVPGICLAAGLVLLSSPSISWWRVLAAALLNWMAIFSFGSGFLVGLVLALPLGLQLQGQSVSRRWLAVGAWLAFTGVGAWLALGEVRGSHEPMNPMILLDRPWMRFQFILILLGQMLGKGTVIEPQVLCALVGAALVMVFTACVACVIRFRRDRELVALSLPWIVCCLYGLGTAILICIGRSFNSLGNSLDERYSALTMFFVVGTMLLAATVVRHQSSSTVLTRCMRLAAGPAFALCLFAHAVNWQAGWNAMRLKYTSMAQESAMLAFVRIVPPDPDWMDTRLTRKSSLSLAKYLDSTHRLPGVKFASNDRVASFELGKKVPAQWAGFDKPRLLEDGHWRLSGTGGLSADDVADLILITAEPEGREERIIGLAAPVLPEAFFEREAQRRKHAERYFGWRHVIAPESLSPGKLTLRAYIYEQDRQRLRPMEGVHVVINSSNYTGLGK
jgi:hypothetical protein